jgi:hypothetical protein
MGLNARVGPLVANRLNDVEHFLATVGLGDESDKYGGLGRNGAQQMTTGEVVKPMCCRSVRRIRARRVRSTISGPTISLRTTAMSPAPKWAPTFSMTRNFVVTHSVSLPTWLCFYQRSGELLPWASPKLLWVHRRTRRLLWHPLSSCGTPYRGS